MRVREDLSYADVVKMRPRLKRVVILHIPNQQPKMFYYYHSTDEDDHSSREQLFSHYV